MFKKLLVIFLVLLICFPGVGFGGQHHGHFRGPSVGFRHSPPPPPPNRHHGFIGGFITGSILGYAMPRPYYPVAVKVWVPPVYGYRAVYDSFGNVVSYERYIITPGYWRIEYR
jgi:hypothetical protein